MRHALLATSLTLLSLSWFAGGLLADGLLEDDLLEDDLLEDDLLAGEKPVPLDQIHLGRGEFGTRQDAIERELFEYRGRWYPESMRKKLRGWEKKDRKTEPWSEAYSTKARHYRIETNVPRFIVELEIKPFLDALYDSYVQIFKKQYGLKGKAASGKAVRIYYGYEDYGRHENEPRGTPAFYSDGTLVSFYDDDDPGEFYNSILHEGAHQFFAAMLPGATLPIWLDEALATYFEAGVYSRADEKLDFSGLPRDRVASAQETLRKEQGDVDLAHLFMDVPYESFEAEHYALAWSFVHYLIHRDGGRRQTAFARFLVEMNGSGVRPAADVFKKSTREKLVDHGAPWRDYVMQMDPGPAIEWVYLEVVDPAGLDLLSDDRLLTIDGMGVSSEGAFERAWENRPKDREYQVSVVRMTPVGNSNDYTTERVTINVPPDSDLDVALGWTTIRSHSLSD